jgi:hypothetical protein
MIEVLSLRPCVLRESVITIFCIASQVAEATQDRRESLFHECRGPFTSVSEIAEWPLGAATFSLILGSGVVFGREASPPLKCKNTAKRLKEKRFHETFGRVFLER